MSLSAKKRARRIRREWAKRWEAIQAYAKAKADPMAFLQLVSPDVAVKNYHRALLERMTGKKAAPESYGMTLPFGYVIACDLGDMNKPLAIVDMKGMERALARDGGIKP